MKTQILYGIGQGVLREFADETKLLGLTKLKDLSVSASGDEEKVTGGDSPYAITTFPKEKTITVTAQNALFDMRFVQATQGGEITTGVANITEIIDFIIPADGVVNLEQTPVESTLVIEGFTKDVTAAAGKYTLAAKVLTFDVSDAGKRAFGVYEYAGSANTQTLSMLKDSVAKPFKFIHRIPVFDDNSQVIGQAQLVIFKCKANNAFEFGLQPLTAFAPQLELEALDPKRPDKKLWDFIVDLGPTT